MDANQLQETPGEGDPALVQEDQVRRMLAPELELDTRNRICRDEYGEEQEWSTLPPEARKEVERRAELHARDDLNSIIGKVLAAEGRAKAARAAAAKKQSAPTNISYYRNKCPVCGNADENKFRQIEGSIVCLGRNYVEDPDDPDRLGSCGFEVRSHNPHEGSFYRKFEGEEDRSHHCKPNNPLFGEAWNSRTGTNFDGVGGGKSQPTEGGRQERARDKTRENERYAEEGSGSVCASIGPFDRPTAPLRTLLVAIPSHLRPFLH